MDTTARVSEDSLRRLGEALRGLRHMDDTPEGLRRYARALRDMSAVALQAAGEIDQTLRDSGERPTLQVVK